MAEGKWVAYYRISTEKQGRSGLGLEAQQAAVRAFLNGGSWKLAREFVEVESGKRDDRPELAKALRTAKVTGSKLVIAKLDKLSRDAHFLLGLQKAGVEFVCADMPNANTLTVGVLAMVAQHEREMISQRTKAALAAAKARGVKLGNPNGALHLHGRGNGEAVAVVKRRAEERAGDLRELIDDIRAGGVTSVRAVAVELNRRGIVTPRGGQWHATSAARLLQRLDRASA